MRRLVVAAGLLLVGVACGAGPAPSSHPATPTLAEELPVRVLAASADTRRSVPSPDAPVDQLVAGFNQAGFTLLGAQEGAKNLVFSPLSIGHALLMARAAADEATGEAIDDLFRLPEGEAAHEAWNALERALADSAHFQDDIGLSMADRVWPHLDVEPEQEWVDLLASQHGATVEVLDLQGNPEGSRETINEWVADQTQGLIPDLLPEGFIDPNTVLVLTDAVYFEARWQTMFGKYPDESGTFTGLEGFTSTVAFMHELELNDVRGTGDGYTGAEIPYVGGEYSMLIVVPDEGRYDEVRDRLDQGLLDEVDGGFSEGPYELFLPRWDHHTDLELLPWLQQHEIAPGSYPAISPDAFLAGAVHGADISVDEQGTVAAAATGIGFNESGPPEPEFTIRADRPFFYVIRHRATGAVLFTGQVTDPES